MLKIGRRTSTTQLSILRDLTHHLVLLCTVFFFAMNTLAAERRETVDRIVAIVNADVITLSELETETETFLNQMRGQLQDGALEGQLPQLRHSVLMAMIERTLQVQAAQALKLTVDDRELDQALGGGQRADSEDPPTSTPTPQQRKVVKDQLLIMKVIQQKIRPSILIPEKTLREYYDSHLQEFEVQGEVRISQIMLSLNGSHDKEHAVVRAQHVLNELRNGRSFEDLAKDYSDGPEAQHGGSLGVVEHAALLPHIQTLIAKLKPGEIGPSVESPAGIHIIRVDSKSSASVQPFEDVRAMIREKLTREKSAEEYQRWLNELKEKAYIQVSL